MMWRIVLAIVSITVCGYLAVVVPPSGITFMLYMVCTTGVYPLLNRLFGSN